MRSKILISFAACAAALTLTAPARAIDPFLWYNGDFNGANGLYDVIGGFNGDGFTYDDFIVPAGQTWNVTGLYSDTITSLGGFTDAYWEIRSGVSAGNGGTLIASGTGGATLTGAPGAFGFNRFLYEVTASTTLGPGTYYLTVAPVDGTGSATYVSTTSGANAIGLPPGNNDNSFFTSPGFGSYFVPANTQVGGAPADFVYGVRGVNGVGAVPEPGAVAFGIVALGSVVGLIARKRKA